MPKLLTRIATGLGLARPHVRRRFDGVGQGRLMADWIFGSTRSADEELRHSLRVLRERSRDLANNNDYVRRFFALLQTNVVGDRGIRLQMRVPSARGDGLDTLAGEKVERAWRAWGHKGSCTVCGGFSWPEVQRLTIQAVARDGEALAGLVEGPNRSGFQLRLIEADLLDEELSRPPPPSGSEIRMGVEINADDRPVRYHLHRRHPGDQVGSTAVTNRHLVVPAQQLLHIYRRDRVGQHRGLPWVVSAMKRLRHMGAYEEAAVIAARAGAAKMGFYEQETGDAYGAAAEEKETGRAPIQEIEPGTFEPLPPGVSFKAFDPGYPDGEFAPFMQAMLRGAAAGLGVNYTSLAMDLERVNFSSIRAGRLEDQDTYRVLQSWLIDHLCRPVFEAWLPRAIATQAIELPPRLIPRLIEGATWRARGWAWVDPLKESQAAAHELANNTRSRKQIAADRGEDFEEIVEQLAAEERLAARAGITLAATPPPPGPVTPED